MTRPRSIVRAGHQGQSPPLTPGQRRVLSGGFGSGHGEGVVGEVGDEFQVPAECLHVAGDGLDG